MRKLHAPVDMNSALLQSALAVYRSRDASTAFRSAIERLEEHLPVIGAVWISAEGAVRERRGEPEEAFDLSEEPGAEIEPVVVRGRKDGGSVVVLVLRRHAVDDRIAVALRDDPTELHAGGWIELRQAFLDLLDRMDADQAHEQDQRRVHTRMEEAEALHLLGVTINRTLDLYEVLQIVTRFARTLLGAHAAAIYLREGDRLQRRHVIGEGMGGEEEEEIVEAVVRTGRPVLRGAGDRLPDAWTAAPLTQADNVIGALILHYRRQFNPSEREARLSTAIATLATVAVANADLHRALEERGRELESLNRELEHQSEMKARFFASVNHELRTPLTAILGYQELVLDGVGGPVPDRILEFVQRARFATDDLLRLVDELLDMSTLHARRMALDLEDVALDDLLRHAHATMEPVAASKDLTFPPPEVDEDVRVRADRGRLRQIVMNLLSNAVKFTESGSVCLGVERWAEWVIVTVTDTGPGIAEADRERIFEEFEQVRGAGKPGGTGLGLAISRRLARLMEGDITVSSPPNGGSTFALRLPTGSGT